jgi:hypothetical protein
MLLFARKLQNKYSIYWYCIYNVTIHSIAMIFINYEYEF